MKKIVRKTVTWLLIFGMVFTPLLTGLDVEIANAETTTLTLTVDERTLEFNTENINEDAQADVIDAQKAIDAAKAAGDFAQAAENAASAAADLADPNKDGSAVKYANEAIDILESLNDNNSALAQQVAAVNTACETAKAEVAEANEMISNAQALIDAAQTAIQNANNAIELAEAQRQLAKAQKQYADANEEYKSKLKNVKALADEADRLKGLADTAIGKVTANESDTTAAMNTADGLIDKALTKEKTQVKEEGTGRVIGSESGIGYYYDKVSNVIGLDKKADTARSEADYAIREAIIQKEAAAQAAIDAETAKEELKSEVEQFEIATSEAVKKIEEDVQAKLDSTDNKWGVPIEAASVAAYDAAKDAMDEAIRQQGIAEAAAARAKANAEEAARQIYEEYPTASEIEAHATAAETAAREAKIAADAAQTMAETARAAEQSAKEIYEYYLGILNGALEAVDKAKTDYSNGIKAWNEKVKELNGDIEKAEQDAIDYNNTITDNLQLVDTSDKAANKANLAHGYLKDAEDRADAAVEKANAAKEAADGKIITQKENINDANTAIDAYNDEVELLDIAKGEYKESLNKFNDEIIDEKVKPAVKEANDEIKNANELIKAANTAMEEANKALDAISAENSDVSKARADLEKAKSDLEKASTAVSQAAEGYESAKELTEFAEDAAGDAAEFVETAETNATKAALKAGDAKNILANALTGKDVATLDKNVSDAESEVSTATQILTNANLDVETARGQVQTALNNQTAVNNEQQPIYNEQDKIFNDKVNELGSATTNGLLKEQADLAEQINSLNTQIGQKVTAINDENLKIAQANTDITELNTKTIPEKKRALEKAEQELAKAQEDLDDANFVTYLYYLAVLQNKKSAKEKAQKELDTANENLTAAETKRTTATQNYNKYLDDKSNLEVQLEAAIENKTEKESKVNDAVTARDNAKTARDEAKGLMDAEAGKVKAANENLEQKQGIVIEKTKELEGKNLLLTAAREERAKVSEFEATKDNTEVLNAEEIELLKKLVKDYGNKNYDQFDSNDYSYSAANGDTDAYRPLVGDTSFGDGVGKVVNFFSNLFGGDDVMHEDSVKQKTAIYNKYSDTLKDYEWLVWKIDDKDESNVDALVRITSDKCTIVCTDAEEIAVIRATLAELKANSAEEEAKVKANAADTAAKTARTALTEYENAKKEVAALFDGKLPEINEIPEGYDSDSIIPELTKEGNYNRRPDKTMENGKPLYDREKLDDQALDTENYDAKVNGYKETVEKYNEDKEKNSELYADKNKKSLFNINEDDDLANLLSSLGVKIGSMEDFQEIAKFPEFEELILKVAAAEQRWKEADLFAKKAEEAAQKAKEAADKARKDANITHNLYDDFISEKGGGEDSSETIIGVDPMSAILPFAGAVTGVAGARRGRAIVADAGEEKVVDTGKKIEKKATVIEEEKVPAAKTPAKKTTTIEDEEIPEAKAPEENGFPWWILILLAACALGYGGYKYYEKKKDEEKVA